MAEAIVTVSVVSHGQNRLTNQFAADLARVCADRIALVVTENVIDDDPLDLGGLACQHEIIVNAQPRGFGANHNAAFARCRTPYYCVANPDIRLSNDPFPALLDAMERNDAGVAGPLVRSPEGRIEDSARRFPTVGSLLVKVFGAPVQPDYPSNLGSIEVDWVAGMFMLFPSDVFRAVSGFDEAYFLYYEDVDICRRLGSAGRGVIYAPHAEVIHDARRASRRNPRLALHHLASALRFLWRA